LFMSKFLRKLYRYGFLFMILIGLILVITSSVHAQKMRAEGKTLPFTDQPQLNRDLVEQVVVDLDIDSSGDVSSTLPPTPVQDQCLHCHIKGEFTNLWIPLSRWMILGTIGIAFAFGIFRNAWVWKNRKPWETFTVRISKWIDARYQVSDILSPILKKPVPTWATRWWYCLGGITATLFVLLGITGIMLAFYYKPTADQAYSSIQFIENQVRFGAAIRAIHHWSANGMVVMCVAHMLRVFIMGAFKSPRELNWVSGVVLLISTFGFGLTGYLLPWDQRAYWASTVATEIAGGVPQIGELILVFMRVGWNVTEATLSRFYAVHVLVLPIMIIVFMGLHFIMVRRQGLARPL